MPLIVIEPRPRTFARIGVNEVKSRRQYVNAADAPVSTTRETLSESNGNADVDVVVENAQRNACMAFSRDCRRVIFLMSEGDNKRGSFM
jgi:hypothetical protein